jgi:hypothetical protein
MEMCTYFIDADGFKVDISMYLATVTAPTVITVTAPTVITALTALTVLTTLTTLTAPTAQGGY